VELAYLAPGHDQLRISGRAEVVTDESTVAEIWAANPLLKQYLGTAQNPEFILYRLVPDRVRFMREWALDYHEVPMGSNKS
jgi:general stress protein 26